MVPFNMQRASERMWFTLRKNKQKALELSKQKVNGEMKITYQQIANISNYSLPLIKHLCKEIKKKILKTY